MLYVNGAWRRNAKDPVKGFRFPFKYPESALEERRAVVRYIAEQLLKEQGIPSSKKTYKITAFANTPEGYTARVHVNTYYNAAEIERAADRGVCLKRGLPVASFEILVYPRTS